MLNGAVGAFVNVIGLAESCTSFVSLAKHKLSDMEFEVINVNDVELVSDRLQRNDLVDELLDLVNNLCDENPILFDEFHAYVE